MRLPFYKNNLRTTAWTPLLRSLQHRNVTTQSNVNVSIQPKSQHADHNPGISSFFPYPESFGGLATQYYNATIIISKTARPLQLN